MRNIFAHVQAGEPKLPNRIVMSPCPDAGLVLSEATPVTSKEKLHD